MANKYNSLPEYEQDVKKAVYSLVATKQQEYLGKHKPFCERCAKETIINKIVTDIKIQERRLGYIDWNKAVVDVNDFAKDLDEYGQASRFTVIKENDAWHRAKGETRESIYGKTIDYKCNVCNAGISVDIPLEETKKK